MRRRDKEIVSRAECDAVLNEAQVAHVAMVDGEKPYVVAMNFAYDGKALYLHCAKEGRKLEILARNPNVSIGAETGVLFVAGDPVCKSTMHYRSAIVTGEAIPVADPDEKRNALEAIARKFTGSAGSVPDDALEKIILLRVEIESVSGKRSPA
jgi:nitroimidazol reductase NimA-like FMN-containing flavoprotein (pyridoxamine 5'-phosphate oxidase superfamily)